MEESESSSLRVNGIDDDEVEDDATELTEVVEEIK
jgi:hypothetical protein